MVSLAERRSAVEFLRQDFELSERRACTLVGQSLSTQRYHRRRVEVPEHSGSTRCVRRASPWKATESWGVVLVAAAVRESPGPW